MVDVDPVLVSAISFSSVFALLSSGLTLTYMTTKVPNFAHGTIAMVGLYTGLTIVDVWGSNPYAYSALAFLLSGSTSVGVYHLVMRPLIKRGASLVSLMIATVGVDFFLFSLINIYADYVSRTYRINSTFFSLDEADFRIDRIGGTSFTPALPGVVIVASAAVIILTAFLHLALKKTRFGVAMRATVENPALAGVVGINVNLVYTVSWFLSGALAGLAGLFAGMFGAGTPQLGIRLIPSVFAASIVGGLTNLYGALLGGFIIGLTQILGTREVARVVGPEIFEYQLLVPLAFIAATLLITPRGITGVDWRDLTRRLRTKLGFAS